MRSLAMFRDIPVKLKVADKRAREEAAFCGIRNLRVRPGRWEKKARRPRQLSRLGWGARTAGTVFASVGGRSTAFDGW